MTATQSAPTAASQLAARPAALAGLPRGPGRVDPAGGGAPLGRPAGVHRPRRRADLHRAGRPRARRRRLAGRPRRRPRATSSPSTSPTAASTRPLYYGILLAGATFSPTNPLLPAADLAAQLTDAGATVLVTWDQVLPFVRAALAATAGARRSIVTGEAHTLDFAARLDARGRRRRPRRPARRRPHRPAPRRRHRPRRRPRPPRLHRRHDRRQQGRRAAAPQRRHQRAPVRLLDLGLAAGARRRRAT